MTLPLHTTLLCSAVLCLLCGSGTTAGAQCGERLVENFRAPNDQRLVTEPQLLVVRAGYAYSLGFSATHEGVRAQFTSRGGSRPKRGDELLLVNRQGERRVFRFVGAAETEEKAGVPTHVNELQLDFDVIDWLAGADVTTVTLIDNTTNQGRRFTIPASRQAELRQLLLCFRDEADVALVPDVPAVATAIPSVGKPLAPKVDRERGLGAGPGTKTLAEAEAERRAAERAEVEALRERLAEEKRTLLEAVAIERAKANRARERHREEVRASRRAAEAERTAIAAEVLAARERAAAEIARARESSATRHREIAAATAAADTAAAEQVARARSRAAIEVAAADASAAEEIAAIRAEAAAAAAVERARYAEAQDAYAARVRTAERRSQARVIEVRRALERDLAAVRREAVLGTDSTAAGLDAAAPLAARKRLLAAREASLRAAAAAEEETARASVRHAVDLAAAERTAAERLAAREAAHLEELTELRAQAVAARTSAALQLKAQAQAARALRTHLTDSLAAALATHGEGSPPSDDRPRRGPSDDQTTATAEAHAAEGSRPDRDVAARERSRTLTRDLAAVAARTAASRRGIDAAERDGVALAQSDAATRQEALAAESMRRSAVIEALRGQHERAAAQRAQGIDSLRAGLAVQLTADSVASRRELSEWTATQRDRITAHTASFAQRLERQRRRDVLRLDSALAAQSGRSPLALPSDDLRAIRTEVYDAEVDELAAATAERLRRLAEETASADSLFEESISRRAAAHEAWAAAETRLAQQRTRTKARELAALQQHAARLDSLSGSHHDAILSLTTAQTQERASLRRRHADSVAYIAEAFARARDDLRTHQLAYGDSLRRERDTLVSQQARALSRARRQHERALVEQRSVYRAAVDSLQAATGIQLAAAATTLLAAETRGTAAQTAARKAERSLALTLDRVAAEVAIAERAAAARLRALESSTEAAATEHAIAVERLHAEIDELILRRDNLRTEAQLLHDARTRTDVTTTPD